MNRIILTALSFLLLTMSSCTGDRRYIHNCDGTDLLSNCSNGFRPLSVADVNSYVDRVCDGGVTTLMVCSGSDYPLYRSSYGRFLGDDRDGTIDCGADTAILRYYRNFKRLEAEGTDYLRAYLTRTKERGREAFITYRMNDLHMCDPAVPIPIHASDFWGAHPEYYVGDEGHGWHREGALNFAFPEVRRQKYDMIAEQLDMYGDIMDGFEMDFCRFIVFFPLGEGAANKDRMTSLVRDVRAKVDSVNREKNTRILLSVRVPDTWISCEFNGLDVRTWVREGLVDFITLAVHWKGDPAVDADAFRKESGIGRRVPVYATIDDGTYRQREVYTHGQWRGAASFALSHGADGIYLFNYFFGPYYEAGNRTTTVNGTVSRMICPELMKDLGSPASLEGRNKTYSYYSANAEYALSYKSPMPLHPSIGCDEELTFHIGDSMKDSRPSQAYLFCRTSAGSQLAVRFNGRELQHSPDDAALAEKCCKADHLKSDEEESCFIIPSDLLRHGKNDVVVSSGSRSVTVSRMELVLDYGDVSECGYF